MATESKHTVARALKYLRQQLGEIGVPATRVEIVMPQTDAEAVQLALRGQDHRPADPDTTRSLCQAAGFLIVGEKGVPDHEGRIGDLIDG